MTARKLRDRLAVAAGLTMTEEPTVSVPKADKTETLKDEAKRGFEAVEALFAERNSATELAADLNQKLNHVQAINVGLREENGYYKQQCECLVKANARLGAYLAQMHDTFRRIASETQQVNSMIEAMPHPAPVSNNPDLPRVNTVGLPVREEPAPERPQRQFDESGIPYNAASVPPTLKHEDLQTIIREMEEQRGAGHA